MPPQRGAPPATMQADPRGGGERPATPGSPSRRCAQRSAPPARNTCGQTAPGPPSSAAAAPGCPTPAPAASAPSRSARGRRKNGSSGGGSRSATATYGTVLSRRDTPLYPISTLLAADNIICHCRITTPAATQESKCPRQHEAASSNRQPAPPGRAPAPWRAPPGWRPGSRCRCGGRRADPGAPLAPGTPGSAGGRREGRREER